MQGGEKRDCRYGSGAQWSDGGGKYREGVIVSESSSWSEMVMIRADATSQRKRCERFDDKKRFCPAEDGKLGRGWAHLFAGCSCVDMRLL